MYHKGQQHDCQTTSTESRVESFVAHTAYRYSNHLIHSVLVVWLSGNALISINEVTLHRARLVLGWVIMCERVNHLGM